MGQKQYATIIEDLKTKGICIEKEKKSLFGARLLLSYPIGEKKMTLDISYSSLFRSLTADIHIPYSPFKGPLMDEYDRIFPEEKNAWGRSTPKFTQAIIDYMRGQKGSGNKVELLNAESDLHLSLAVGVAAGGDGGLKHGLERLSFELRKGAIHEDVLTHMFAY